MFAASQCSFLLNLVRFSYHFGAALTCLLRRHDFDVSTVELLREVLALCYYGLRGSQVPLTLTPFVAFLRDDS